MYVQIPENDLVAGADDMKTDPIETRTSSKMATNHNSLMHKAQNSRDYFVGCNYIGEANKSRAPLQ